MLPRSNAIRRRNALVAHHQGAIAMAQYEIESGQYPPAIAMSQSIVTSQRKEIDEMQAILATL